MSEHDDLPSGWAAAPLRYVATINPPYPVNVPADGTLVSFVPMAAVEVLSGRMDPRTRRPWSDVKKGYTRFQEGDVVFAKITPCMENGKIALAANLLHGIAAGTTEFHVFRPQPGVAGRYLLHYLLQETFRRRARARMTGTAGQLRVPAQFLEEEAIPLAPTSEQQRVVEAVDSYLTRLDDAVASLERVQAKLKAYRASVLKAAVEGRLVPTEASLARAEKRDYEPAEALLARVLKERRRRWEEAELAKLKAAGKVPKDDKWKGKYEELVVPDVSTLPGLPEGWCWASIEQLASDEARSIQSGPFGSNLLHSEFRGKGRLVVGIDNVQDGYFSMGAEHRISEEKFQELEHYQARGGDVLVTVMATVGRTCVVPDGLEPAIITKHVYRITPNRDVVMPGYLHLALWGGPPVRKQMFGQVIGQTRPGLNGGVIRKLAIPLPPIEEQFRIVDAADLLLSARDQVIAELSTSSRRVQRLRQAILKWAFEGKLVDQDPSDEPGEELLARIRAERAAVAPTKKSRGRTAKGAA